MRDETAIAYPIDGFPHSSPISTRPEPDGLRRLPIFDGVDEEIASGLTRNCSASQFRSGSIILRQGDPLTGLYIVHRGIVDLTHVHHDHGCGVLLLSAKDLLMPSATLFREPALVSARALTNVKLIMFEGRAVESALSQSHALSKNLMRAISGQWRMAVRNIVDLNRRSAAQRLGAFLLRITDLQPNCETWLLPIPKRHLAIRLGMTAETLSRMLQVVARHGLYLRGRTIIVRDRTAIEEFCGPAPYPQNDERALDVFAL